MKHTKPEENPQANGQQAEVAPAKPTRVPFKIDDDIAIRSLTNAAHRTRSKVIGAVHGDFILIKEPVVMINDRLSAVLDDNMLCSYFTEGYLYNFPSRYRTHLVGDIVSIEYPREVEVTQVRRHRRIRVNIETQCAIHGTVDWFLGDMVDISHGGCRLALHSRVPLTKGMFVDLAFSLPNEQVIKNLKAAVMSVRFIKSRELTDVGLSFKGPDSELQKICGFCDFCMFFDLD